MQTRSQTRAKAFKWMSLPAEIRLMILEAIAHQKNPGWGSLASVCREWRYVLEGANFYKMNLGISCLNDFKRIASPQKRNLIRHICLNVELPEYMSRCCSKRRSPPTRANAIFNEGLWKLCYILSTWEASCDLALEINIYSPSDCKHWFKNIYLSSDDTEHDDEDTMLEALRTEPVFHDPKHGWEHGRQVKAPPSSALSRLFKRIWLTCPEALPRIKAVTRFIIRRQLRRCIGPMGLGLLLSKFERLEHVSYEPWAPYDEEAGQFLDRALSFSIQTHFPNTLKKLTIFEESYKFYDRFPRRPAQVPWYGLFDVTGGLGVVLASKSLQLQHLAISYMINAEEIFSHCQSTWSWPHLQSLALTSQLLENDLTKHKQIEDLLRRAGVLVRQMPKMHTFVLWNGGRAHACAFIYRLDRGYASITWRGTWNLALSPRVIESWQLVASKELPFRRFQLKNEHIQEAIRSHGDAIYHLELPCEVVDPASLWQIRKEAFSLA
ncbi:hypothetical protein F4774DRAFT_428732 [Daldinia eschscholtzii]|nr:hypothetical protein F4774DRAFT_428732 [Daldinia eschscholtzii]